MKTIEQKAKAYDEIIERAKTMLSAGEVMYGKENNASQLITDLIPELRESEDERIRRSLVRFLTKIKDISESGRTSWAVRKEDAETCTVFLKYLEKQKEPADKGEISDGYHTFNELYYYRMLYNAAFFNLLPKHLVHKSRRHHDGEECFGGGWFIVMAQLPTGQISNHYELKDWDLFQVPEQEKADEWDGHTPKEAAERIFRYLQLKQKPAWSEEDEAFLNTTICFLEGKFISDSARLQCIEKLRFLRPFPHWKPSEEQMAVLLNAEGLMRAGNYPESTRILAELYAELKQL